MSKFIYVLTIILVLAKIFSLITISWGACLAPFVLYVFVKAMFWAILLGKATEVLKEMDEKE